MEVIEKKNYKLHMTDKEYNSIYETIIAMHKLGETNYFNYFCKERGIENPVIVKDFHDLADFLACLLDEAY